MSETVADVPPVAEPTPTPAPDATPQPQAGAEPAAQTPPETPPETPAEPAPKPRRPERHIANLTARLAAERVEREAAERRAEAAEALLRAGKDGTETAPAPRNETPDRAAIRAEIEFDEKRAKLIDEGQKAYPDWVDRTNVIHQFGGTQNPAFMQALVELPNAPKIVATLADDTDALVELLRKSPAAMAAQLGRMDAKMETAAAKPISRAPAPAPKVEASAVVAEPTIYDDSLSMREWAKLWDKQAPPHLRGR
jgi:hypothetical protein